jgi:hypothetical protein
MLSSTLTALASSVGHAGCKVDGQCSAVEKDVAVAVIRADIGDVQVTLETARARRKMLSSTFFAESGLL